MDTGLGEGMRHMEKRFRATYNKQTGTWRLLDSWHDAMQKITDWNAEIPDDCPAIVLITDEGFTTLAMEAARLGILGKAVMPKEVDPEIISGVEGIKAEYHELQQKYEDLQKEKVLLVAEMQGVGNQLLDLQRENVGLIAEVTRAKQVPPMSDQYTLKSQIVQGLVKLAGMESIKNIDG